MSHKISESGKSLSGQKLRNRKQDAQKLEENQGELKKWIEEQTADLAKANERLKKDIKKHKKRQKQTLNKSAELTELKKRYETAIKASGKILYDCNFQTQEVVFSGPVKKVLGYTIEEIGGNFSSWLELVHPDDRAGFTKAVELEKVIRKPFNMVYRIRRKDGTYSLIKDRGRTYFDSSGNVLHTAGFIEDITERKRKEWEINVLNNITQAMNESLKLEEIYKVALDKITELKYVDIAGIYIVDENTNEAVLQDYRNFPDDYVKRAGKIPYPRGITWKVINRGKIYNIKNVQNRPDLGSAGKDLGHHGALGIPIVSYTKKVLGVIWLLSYKEHQFTQMEVDFLTSIGNQVAIAIARANLYKELSKKNRYDSILSAVTQSVHKSMELQEVLENAVESMHNNMDNVKHVSIYLVEGNEAVMRAHRGYTRRFIKKAGRIPYPNGFTWKTIIYEKPRYISDTEKGEVMGPAGKELGTKSYLSMPISVEGKTIGVININSIIKNAYDEDEIKLLKAISQQLEVAINHAQNIKRLQEAEQRYRTLFKHSPDAVVIIDPETAMPVDFNDAIFDILGYSKEGFLKLSIPDIEAKETPEEVRIHIKKIIKKGYDVFESRLRRKDGRVINVLVNVRKVELSGKILLESIIRDITEQKKAENALKLSELRLEEAQRIGHIGNWLWDIKTDEVRWSNELYRIFGLKPKGFKTSNKKSLSPVHPDDRKFVEKSIEEALYKGKPYSIEHRIVLQDGNERIVHVQGEVNFNDNGDPISMIGTVQDITDRKKIEDVLVTRVKQQAAVAEIGKLALEENIEISTLMDKALSLVAECLNVEFCKILRLLPRENEFVMISGIGWKYGNVGHTKIPTGTESPSGYTLMAKETIIIHDLRKEKRFKAPPLLTEHSVVSGITTIIHGSDKPFGILGAHTSKQAEFTVDDINFFESVANIITASIQKIGTIEALNTTNQELEIINNLTRAVNAITQAMNESFKLEEIYKVALDKIIELQYVDIVGIYIIDENSNEAVLQDYRNFPDGFLARASRIPYPKGVTWKIINTGKILNVKNAAEDPDVGPAGRELGFRSMLGLPIFLEEKTIGVLWLLSYKEHQFTQMEVDFLTSIGRQIALSVAKAELYKKLYKQNRNEKIISDITQSVHKSIDLQVVLDSAVESIKKNMDNVDNISIYLVEGDFAVLKAYRGYTKRFIKEVGAIPYPKGFTWKTIIDGKSTYVADVDIDTVIGPAGRAIGTKSYYSSPVKFKSKTVGAVNINSLSKNAFDQDDLDLLETVTNQIEIAYSHARNAEALKKSEQLIRSITEGTSLATGNEFFPLLVRYISDALDVPYTFVSEYIKKDDITLGRVISGWTDKCYVEPFEYDLKDMPCEKNTIADGILYYPNNVQEHFPKYKELADMEVVSYLGIPITDSSKNIIGILNIMDKKPIYNQDELLPVLKIFASRAGAELERLQAEDELRKFSRIIKQTADPVMITDKAGVIEYVNPAFEKLTGYSKEEVIGKTSRLLKSGKHTEEFYETLWQEILSGNAFNAVFTNMKKSGELYFEEKTITPMKDASGKITHFVSTGKDITDRKRLEEELIKAQKMESISILAGGIAHDFNNLLAVILGNVSHAKMYVNPDDEMSMIMLQDAEEACERAKDLTYQLLTFSKGGAPVKQLASIAEIIKDSARFSLMGSKAGCEFNIPDDLSSVEIDVGQISQVMQNIVINADQAMPESGLIKISAQNVTLTGKKSDLPLKNGRYIKICIEDQGVGIPQEYLNKVFDPYFSTKQKGSGLGLATTYSIIKKHGGYITVESEIGAGSNFIIYLPASDKEVEIKQIEPGILESSGKVLIMDDDEKIGTMLELMLTNIGYNVEVVFEGAKAVELYKKRMQEGQYFDAVILDLTVSGGMGGKQAMEMLLKIDPGVKALVSSGYSSDPAMSEYKKYGFRGCIAKPYTIQQLSNMLKSVIES